MQRFLIFCLIFLFLTGCTMRQNPVIEVMENSGIKVTSVISTGTFEIYDKSNYFHLLKNHSGCFVDSGENKLELVRCDGIHGYDYFYEIPSLRLSYLYQPVRLGNTDMLIGQFINEVIPVKDPMIISGNIMYSLGSGGINPLLSTIVMKNKGLHENPIDVMNKLITSGCNFHQINVDRVADNKYVAYTVDLFNDNIRCIVDKDLIGSDFIWNIIFSKEPKDYYYIVGDYGDGNASHSYVNNTLKLFVE